MADWDQDGPRLRANLESVFKEVADAALRREALTLSVIKQWHAGTMRGLVVPDKACVARFRGEPGLEKCQVRVGDHLGVPPKSVAAAAQVFISKLHTAIAELDARYHAPDDLDADGFEAVIEVAGWAHSEWVRIHPFANGNGRTARILTNAILMRYGLPPALRLRPRPHGPYAAAGLASMKREWADMVAFLRSTVLAAIADAQP